MAKAIEYDRPALEEPDKAQIELNRLLDNLHRQGILRFLNDFLQASPQAAEAVLQGLNIEESSNAVQNLTLLAIAIGRIPPERFGVLTRAFTEGVIRMEEAANGEDQEAAPGMAGLYKLLHDNELWQGLQPVLAGVRGFGGPLHEAANKPAAKRDPETTA